MTQRYYCEPTDSATPWPAGELVTLADTESHHLVHVMRARVGAEVELFDGRGWEYQAEVVRCDRRGCVLRVLRRDQVSRELPRSMIVGVALPKADRQRYLVERLVELGVHQLVPLMTARSVVHPKEKAGGKLARAVIEAAKQCRRNALMQIDRPVAWQDFVQRPTAGDVRWLAHPGGERLATAGPPQTSPGRVYLAIGPEGGLTSGEIDVAVRAGWTPVDLGARILRIETAAALLAGWWALQLDRERRD